MRFVFEAPDAPEPYVLAPEQLTPGLGIVNVGTVASAPRKVTETSVFVAVDVKALRISLATGKIVENTETLILHESDDVWVVDGEV